MMLDLSVIIASVAGVAVTYYLTKKHELTRRLMKEKVNHYRVLVSSLSDIVADNNNLAAQCRFALARNTIALVAPQKVIDTLLEFHKYILKSNTNHTIEEHDRLLTELMLAIREDLKIEPKDDPSTFKYWMATYK